MQKTVAFIPVRGDSTSIPFKNIKQMCGQPLVYWSAAAASSVEAIENIYISTDSGRIREVVERLQIPKVEVIARSPETATNTASSESALLEFAKRFDFDRVVFIQATSPLLLPRDLERGLAEMDSPSCDSVISVVRNKCFYWKTLPNGDVEPINYDVFNRPRRQDFTGCLQENGAFYITNRLDLLATGNRVSGRIRAVEMTENSFLEIDEPDDWMIVEELLRRQIAKQSAYIAYNGVRLFLTDCDGCMTDAGMYYGEGGEEFKRFDTRDGLGIRLLKDRGIKCGIITGEMSYAAKRRSDKLSMDFLELDCNDKLASVRNICELEGVSLREVAYVGDDLNDVDLLRSVGYSFAPNNACDTVKKCVDVVLKSSGGYGAIREAAEIIINNEYEDKASIKSKT